MTRQIPISSLAVLNLVEKGETKTKAFLIAGKACATVFELALAARKLDRWPNQAEYAAYRKIDERTAQREWANFRLAFPDEATPDRYAQHVLGVMGSRIQKPESEAFTVVAPPERQQTLI